MLSILLGVAETSNLVNPVEGLAAFEISIRYNLGLVSVEAGKLYREVEI